jgi:uncharacterized protein YndB with AHSA1/START domain
MSVELHLSRDLYVPRELVFDVWTQEEHLTQWYSPTPAQQRTVRLRAVPGGRFALAWSDNGGPVTVDEGEFVEIRRPEGFSCRLGPPGVASSGYLEVRLVELGGACRIELTHGGFASAEARDARGQVWRSLLARLEDYFSAI